jgi:hypothetical protein
MFRHFDENIIIGVLSGGIVSVLSEAVQRNVIAEAGGLACVVFALGYAIYVKLINKKQTEFEQIWKENRKSVLNSLLSKVDDDFLVMNEIFEKLELQGFDFKTESNKINFEDLVNINYDSIKERFHGLPPFQNILGFITSDQYDAVSNYLMYSMMFTEPFDKQNYHDILKSRKEEAKKILEFFSDEVNNHVALKEWKKYFS